MTPDDLNRAEMMLTTFPTPGRRPETPHAWFQLDGKMYDIQSFFRELKQSWEEDRK